MTTITIAYEVPSEKLQEVEALVERESIRNVNFNGEAFTVERGEFTSIDKDGAEYVMLLNKVNEIIQGY